MEFITVSGGQYSVGQRTNALDGRALEVLAADPAWEFVRDKRMSPRRTIDIPSFEISAAPVPVVTLISPDLADRLSGLDELCDHIDGILEPRQLRLPTEDEFEAAFGGSAFPWGDTLPDGEPIQEKALADGPRGLLYAADTYTTEICRTAIKLGDGGEAICGGYGWPHPWLSLLVSHRLDAGEVDGLLYEYAESANARMVRVA